uniref:Transposase n=1 Tax=Rhizobium loti TaxID=381 RepID=M5ALM1_RHILI|nr:conserved hypothetical protein [Mesorhizobium loti NZP2037]
MVGIDDWSWRGTTLCGTIMVDLERHSLVDILDDRVSIAQPGGCGIIPSSRSSAETAAACMREPSVKAHRGLARWPTDFICRESSYGNRGTDEP